MNNEKKNGYDRDFANLIGAGCPGIRFDGDCMIVDRVRKLLCKLCTGKTFVILFIVNGPCNGVGFSVATLYNMYYICRYIYICIIFLGDCGCEDDDFERSARVPLLRRVVVRLK